MFNIKELVLRELELEESINKKFNDIDMVEDLMSIEKYKGSTTLVDRLNTLNKQVEEMIAEYIDIKKTIKELQEIINEEIGDISESVEAIARMQSEIEEIKREFDLINVEELDLETLLKLTKMLQ